MNCLDISSYKYILFDCDGVILDSNKVKSDAFYDAALSWGEDAASALLKYHKANGGISRFHKFQYFMNTILPSLPNSDLTTGIGLQEMIDLYAYLVSQNLHLCRVSSALPRLRTLCANSSWLVVSGGYQDELRSLFLSRNLHHFFDSGIYGSPSTKYQIVNSFFSDRICSASDVLFLGDSVHDFEVASSFGFDFIFLYDWSDVSDWMSFTNLHDIVALSSLHDLLL